MLDIQIYMKTMHMSLCSFFLSCEAKAKLVVEKTLSGEEGNVLGKEIPQTSPGQAYSSLEKWVL